MSVPPDAVTFGISPFPQIAPFAEFAARVEKAEGFGFDHVWVADQTAISYPGIIGSEAWTLLAAVAARTSRVTLGTLVTPVSFRHPLITAMLASGLDNVSGGRAVIGLGAGYVPSDLAGLGLESTSARELVDRLDEQAGIIDALLRGETVTREEGLIRLRDAVVERGIQRPRPPILIGAQGPRAIRIAARHADIWNTAGGQPIHGDRVSDREALAETRRQIDTLEDELQRSGRDPRSVRRSVLEWRVDIWPSNQAFVDWFGTYHELGFRQFDTYWPTDEATIERIATDVIPTLRG